MRICFILIKQIDGQLHGHLQGVTSRLEREVTTREILSLLLFADSVCVLHELTAEKARIRYILLFYAWRIIMRQIFSAKPYGCIRKYIYFFL